MSAGTRFLGANEEFTEQLIMLCECNGEGLTINKKMILDTLMTTQRRLEHTLEALK